MSNHSRDPILLTPGPLTTSTAVKQAMVHDWGSRDSGFIEINRRVRDMLLEIIGGKESHVCVPLQGSGTFAVEAMLGTLVPRDGHVLVPQNGAYCKRAARLTTLMGRRCSVVAFDEALPVSAQMVDDTLTTDPSVTHVVLIHCETGAGVSVDHDPG